MMIDYLTMLGDISGNIHTGLAVIGVGLGIGLIGAKAAEATGRNPSAATSILVLAIILSALIEGLAFVVILS